MITRGFGSLPAQDAPASKACPTFGGFASWRVDLGASEVTPPQAEATESKPACSLWQLVMYALWLGALGFIGTITGAVVVLGKRSIVDLPTVLIMIITIALIWKVKKLPEPVIVALAEVAGLMIYPLFKT